MTTKTTVHLTLGRAASWLDRQQIPPALIVAALVFVVAGGISGVSKLSSAPEVVPAPTAPLPIIIIASPLPIAPPTAAPIQVAAVPTVQTQHSASLRRAVVAYDSPNGAVIGAIEQGRAYQVLARYGGDWLQADVAGSGVVWLKADQLLDLPPDLVDLAPPAAPQVVYQVVNQIAPAEAAPTPAHDYQAPSERERNIQGRLVEPVYPTLAPMEQNNVTQEWARQQWAAEHPELSRKQLLTSEELRP